MLHVQTYFFFLNNFIFTFVAHFLKYFRVFGIGFGLTPGTLITFSIYLFTIGSENTEILWV